MNDRIRGALVVALIALVTIGVGVGTEIDVAVMGGFVVLGIAAISLAAGLAQGMSPPDQQNPRRERWRRPTD